MIGGNQPVLLGFCLNRFFRFDRAEIERGSEVAVSRILQFVGEAVRIVEIAFQHLLHEGGGIDHFLQSMCLHGIGIQPEVLQERVEVFDLADIIRIIFGVARYDGVVRDAFQRQFHITIVKSVSRICGQHHVSPKKLWQNLCVNQL
ncbi:hypothetical protein D3C87_1193390 [compost metagenome]